MSVVLYITHVAADSQSFVVGAGEGCSTHLGRCLCCGNRAAAEKQLMNHILVAQTKIERERNTLFRSLLFG